MPDNQHPVALLILDGWGYSEQQDHNAILSANTPVWDSLWERYPHMLLYASGADVGLPTEQMGNSEVGHLNLGAGRVVYQEITRVSRSIRTGSFFTNRTLTDAVDKAVDNKKAIHILGLLSPGGVHSHQDHIMAFAKLAVERGARRVYLHAFLDGRDTPPKSAAESLELMEKTFSELGDGCIASIIGRYFAMDRDHRWPRIQSAYELFAEGKAEFTAHSALEALEMAYARGESDEFVQATTIVPEGGEAVSIQDGDVIMSMNYRSDRARQFTRAIIEKDFDGFERNTLLYDNPFISLTEYKSDFDIPVAFPPERLTNVFGEYIASLGMRQLRIAETEKYAHVTFFFNGGKEEPFEGEDRILIPSPNVATYDLKPEMSAFEVTDKLVDAIRNGKYDTFICNFANPDMVGHSGNFEATVKAIEAVDTCLGRIHQALQEVGGEMLVTADHGNAEQMRNEQAGQAHTAHTLNPVPLLYVGREATMEENGALQDIAPTLLTLMDLDIPDEMGGHSLVKFA